jgi:hypothetical protein
MTMLDLAREIGLDPVKHSNLGGGEYICLCPNPNECKFSGDDRFHLWPEEKSKRCIGRYWCRTCGISGDTISFCIDIMGMD